MALSPMTPVPIAWENCLVDLRPTSLYGADHDTAMINTTMLLQAPSAEEVIFVLPAADAPKQAPVMRVIADTPGTVHEFEDTTFDDVKGELADAFKRMKEMERQFYELVKEQVKGGVAQTRVKINPSDQLVRLHYPQRVLRQPDGSFEFWVLAPLASFLLNPRGGEISFVVGLPRVMGRGLTLQQASAENPPGTPIGDLTERPMLAQRQFAAHFLHMDPLYRIRYTYG